MEKNADSKPNMVSIIMPTVAQYNCNQKKTIKAGPGEDITKLCFDWIKEFAQNQFAISDSGAFIPWHSVVLLEPKYSVANGD